MSRITFKIKNKEKQVHSNIINKTYDQNCDKVFSMISDHRKNKFLVVGKVQSGKTKNMIDLCERILNSKTLGISNIIILTGTKSNLNQQTFDRFSSHFKSSGVSVLNSSQVKFNTTQQKIWQNNIIISLKNPTKISDITKLLQKTTNSTTLIIDDEADHASLNNFNNRGQGKQLSKKESKTYSNIISMLRQGKIKYLGYTATPMGLMLGGIENELSPEAAVTIEPGSGYFGVEDFIDSKFIYHQIPDQESLFAGVGLTKSLKDSIDYYLTVINSMTARKHFDSNFGINMVIHNSQLQGDHIDLSSSITNYVNSLKFNNIPEVVVLNGTNKQKDNLFSNPAESLRNRIIVGGELLSRGYTVPNLTTFYSTKTAKKLTADTIYQRMRFAGYRTSYIDYIRIYITEEMYNFYNEVYKNENLLFAHINKNSSTNQPIYKNKVWFLTKYSNLMPTRNGVLSPTITDSQFKSDNILLCEPYKNTSFALNYLKIRNFLAGLNEITSEDYKKSKGDKYSLFKLDSLKELFNELSTLDLGKENSQKINNLEKVMAYSELESEVQVFVAAHDNIINEWYKPNKRNTKNTRLSRNGVVTFIGDSERKLLEEINEVGEVMVIFLKDVTILDNVSNVSRRVTLLDFKLPGERVLLSYGI